MVALGGGHGLFAMLTALRTLDVELTAVVTVADDGGSSGRLRRDIAGVLPPGDLRMALAALASDDATGRLWGETFQHRFSGQGALAGHPVGNLVLVGLAQVLDDPVAALDAAGRMLGARGRVLPMACTPLDLVAEVTGLDEDPLAVRRIRGQVAVAATPGQVQSVTLEPTDVRACEQAIAAVEQADLITLGPAPGSPVCCRICCFPDWPKRSPAPGPPGWWFSISHRNPVKQRDSRRSSTWTYSLHTCPVCGSTPCWPTPAPFRSRSAWPRRPRGWGRGWTWPMSPPATTGSGTTPWHWLWRCERCWTE